jgi:indolepyruvate ferredoxin oxidoreductase, beta subunit
MSLNKKSSPLYLMVLGVGGQGVITFSDILSTALLWEHYPVRTFIRSGLGHLGASVISHIIIGESFSPRIPRGQVDIAVSMDMLESLSHIDYLNRNSYLLQYISYIPTYQQKRDGIHKTPEEMMNTLNMRCNLVAINPPDITSVYSKCTNMLMLGALAGFAGFPCEDNLKKALHSHLINMVEENIAAFHKGKEIMNLTRKSHNA